eukprot:CAMPEP_0171811378 /NCGR_PEP_ID=MMETSP0991-20121206/78070_1 /TAXON_ID=483369 /ORGANISM="non described non described, Strain CCMP2098" /LENGTH=509 /DNA_ID=CAMNT_0012424729 /DNA_START=222 /DNA_END=1751 /DNA_ORIENTATION=+
MVKILVTLLCVLLHECTASQMVCSGDEYMFLEDSVPTTSTVIGSATVRGDTLLAGLNAGGSLGGRSYLGSYCSSSTHYQPTYMSGLPLAGKSLSWEVDLSGAGCGCNLAFYLTSMRQNSQVGNCGDYYCDANAVCGVACAEVDLMEANMHSFHSTLHGKADPYGVAGGFGGGGLPAFPSDTGWDGPRDFTAAQYKPGSWCIDTSRAFSVKTSFPLKDDGMLLRMEVALSQSNSDEDGGDSAPPCELTFAVGEGYAFLTEMTAALKSGMTPIVSYWSSGDMAWMDGQGVDGKGGCAPYTTPNCNASAAGKISNLRVESLPLVVAAAPSNSTKANTQAEPLPSPSSSATESVSAGAIAGLVAAFLLCAGCVGFSVGYQMYLRYGYGARCFNPLMESMDEFEAWGKAGYKVDFGPGGGKGGLASKEVRGDEEAAPARRKKPREQRKGSRGNTGIRLSREGGGGRRGARGGGNVAPRDWMDKKPKIGPAVNNPQETGTEMGPSISPSAGVGYV